MKKLFLLSLILLSCSLTACAAKTATPGAPTTAITASVDTAQRSLYALGAALEATPKVMEGLYSAGKITKADYNAVTPIYNQALASFKLAVAALNTAVASGADPNGSTAYLAALSGFLTDKANVDNLMTALGGAK